MLSQGLKATRTLLAVARFRPFETGTPHGRSQERYRRVLWTAIGAVLSRVLNMALGLISVPLTLHYLGPKRYGLWMTISSFVAFLNFSDAGVGNGLVNGIARANGTNDPELAQRYVSSAFLVLTVIASILALFFGCMYPFIYWEAIFRTGTAGNLGEVRPALASLVACFLAGLPLGIAGRVQSGYQQGSLSNLWSCLGAVFGIVLVVWAISSHASLALLVLALAGGPLAAQLLNGAVYFCYQRPWLFPTLSSATRSTSEDLLRRGAYFFVLQVCMAVSFSSDNLVLARVLGPQAVAQYAVPARLFGFVNVACITALGALWPAYGEALARNDHGWIFKTFVRSLILTALISGSAGLLLACFGSRLVYYWVGPAIHPSPILLIALAIWSVVFSLSSTMSLFLNGLSIMSFQVKICAVGAGTNILLSIYLTRIIGSAGVVYGSILAQVVAVLLPSIFYISRHRSKLLNSNSPA